MVWIRPITFTRMFEPRHNILLNVRVGIRNNVVSWLKHSRESNRSIPGPTAFSTGVFFSNICCRSDWKTFMLASEVLIIRWSDSQSNWQTLENGSGSDCQIDGRQSIPALSIPAVIPNVVPNGPRGRKSQRKGRKNA